MKNLTEYNDFRNKKRDSLETESVNEGAQLYDNVWKVRMRVEIPDSLINQYIKKVKDETGEDPKQKWSSQEISEEIAKYVTTSFMTIENLPVSIITSVESEPKAQVQETMPTQTQVQQPVQEPTAQVEPSAQPAPQSQPVAQPVAQTPAQNASQVVPQTEAPTAEI